MSYIWSLLFASFCLTVGFFDIRDRRVPNPLNLFGLVGQIIWLIAIYIRPKGSLNYLFFAPPTTAITGLLTALLLFFPLWRFKAMGAGDVKFMAVLGFCIGLSGLFPALIIGSLLAGVHAVAAIMAKGWSGARAIWRLAPDVRRGIPYAAYTAIGALFGAVWLLFQPQPWLTMLAGS